MSDRKLAAWQAAGLIDAATAQRIRSYEAQHARPLALWAVIGIGALAIALGLISVVAANWDAIPAMVRLGVHLALLAAAAAALWAMRGRNPWGEEALLFVFGALGLTFMGHIGQAYQTTSPLWQPLALWLALFGPLFLLRGAGWLTAAALGGVLILCVWGFADENKAFSGSVLAFALPTAIPLALAPLGAALRERSIRQEFWRRIEQIGLAYALSGASGIAVLSMEAFARGGDAAKVLPTFLVWAAAALAATAAIWAVRKDRSGQAAAGIMAAAGAVALVAYPLSGHAIGAALLFMALWAMVADCALRGGWRGVFQLAVALLALRLIVLSFELEDDLLSSGAGLIVSGLLILGVAWSAVQVARRFAPPKDGEA